MSVDSSASIRLDKALSQFRKRKRTPFYLLLRAKIERETRKKFSKVSQVLDECYSEYVRSDSVPIAPSHLRS